MPSEAPKITDYFQRRLNVDEPISQTAKTSTSKVSSVEPVAKRRQAYLDFGQKGLAQKTCKDCGMCYDPAFKEDVQRHQRFHQQQNKELQFTLPASAIAMEDIAGVATIYKLTEHTKQIEQLVRDINGLMAAADIPSLPPSLQLYLALDRESRVKGAVLAETTKTAFLLPLDALKAGALVISDSLPSHPAAIGITRIWTAPSGRRTGLATRLLEAVRKGFARPLAVSKKMIAFSQPTTEGLALATRYQQGLFTDGLCLVYTATSTT